METQQNSQVVKRPFSLSFLFLALGVVISGITSVVSFLTLVFNILNKQFPDVLNSTYQYGYNSYDYDSIRSAMATLIIFFPIYIIISYFFNKRTKLGLGKIDEIIRKWLIYIILFFSALVVAIDLVALVRYFVAGEITTRFILKVLAVLIIIFIIGMYYIFSLRGWKKIFKRIDIGVWVVIKSSVLVLVLIFWSFHVMGTPKQQRLSRLDDKRVQDLQNIQGQIINYWQQKSKLPISLNDLVNPLSGTSLPIDPEFEKGKTYEYDVKTDNKDTHSFELCATFSLPIPKGWQENQNYGYGVPIAYPMGASGSTVSSMPIIPNMGGINESWDHQAGRTCFERTIDNDLYPPYPKPLTQ